MCRAIFRVGMGAAVVWLVAAGVCLGTDFAPKTDNRIVCLDLRTGELVWEHVPEKLSDAHFEWYPEGVVAYPNYGGENRSNPLFLDAKSGKTVAAFPREPKDLLARSATFWPGPEVRLENGWRLANFSPGNSKTLVFHDAADKKVWEIPTPGYPHEVRSWKNLVFWAYSYLSKEGVLYAYRAGAPVEKGDPKPAWTVDLNTIVRGRDEPLTRMIFQVIEDRLYVEANEHIFCLDPETGKLHWHRDLAKDLNLPFDGGFFGGGLNLALFAKSGDVLLISFENRVVALDLKAGKCLWHLYPHTFPHCPFPAAHGHIASC